MHALLLWTSPSALSGTTLALPLAEGPWPWSAWSKETIQTRRPPSGCTSNLAPILKWWVVEVLNMLMEWLGRRADKGTQKLVLPLTLEGWCSSFGRLSCVLGHRMTSVMYLLLIIPLYCTNRCTNVLIFSIGSNILTDRLSQDSLLPCCSVCPHPFYIVHLSKECHLSK